MRTAKTISQNVDEATMVQTAVSFNLTPAAYANLGVQVNSRP